MISCRLFRLQSWIFKDGGREGQQNESTLSFAKYGLLIYTPWPVIEANTLRKDSGNEAEIQPIFCHFVLLTANIPIILLYTISPVLETPPPPLVLKAQRNRLG